MHQHGSTASLAADDDEGYAQPASESSAMKLEMQVIGFLPQQATAQINGPIHRWLCHVDLMLWVALAASAVSLLTLVFGLPRI